MTVWTPLLGAALGLATTVTAAWLATLARRRERRRIGLQMWRDDMYTMGDLINHAGEQRQWPGPANLYWKPTLMPELLADINYMGKRSVGPNSAWARVTAAQRTITFVLAWWTTRDNTNPDLTDHEVEVLRGAFEKVELGRIALSTIIPRIGDRIRWASRDRPTRLPRPWRPGCSVWADIREPWPHADSSN